MFSHGQCSVGKLLKFKKRYHKGTIQLKKGGGGDFDNFFSQNRYLKINLYGMGSKKKQSYPLICLYVFILIINDLLFGLC